MKKIIFGFVLLSASQFSFADSNGDSKKISPLQLEPPKVTCRLSYSKHDSSRYGIKFNPIKTFEVTSAPNLLSEEGFRIEVSLNRAFSAEDLTHLNSYVFLVKVQKWDSESLLSTIVKSTEAPTRHSTSLKVENETLAINCYINSPEGAIF